MFHVKLLSSITCILIINFLSSQNKDSINSDQVVKNFKLQSHKGLFKFGILDYADSKNELIVNKLNDNYRLFKGFLKNYTSLDSKENPLEGYYVTESLISEYDFENNGFWFSTAINLSYSPSNNSLLIQDHINSDKLYRTIGNQARHGYKLKDIFSVAHFFYDHKHNAIKGDIVYEPRNEFEHIISDGYSVALLENSVDEANKLVNLKSIFIVRKVKLLPNLKFYITSPIIELYTDRSLKNKIKEIDYNDLIFHP